MYIVRDLFRCKPGKAGEVAQKFKAAFAADQGNGGMRNPKVMVDMVSSYWTVVIESEVDNLAKYEKEIEEYRSRAGMQESLKGYMELVEGGQREIYRVL